MNLGRSMAEEKKKMGRPKKEISETTFIGLCQIMCTQEEMCAILDCDHKTLTKWCEEELGMTYSQAYKKYTAEGKTSLRRAQWNMAVKKNNPTMQVWLGKQWLGQKESQTITLDNEIDDDGLLGALEKGLAKDED